jgi:PAS domain S-box-containing protein
MGSPLVPTRRSTGSSFRAEIASKDSRGAVDHLTEVKRSHGVHDVLFESAPDAMLTTDQEGRILEVNAETERHFGYGRHELIDESIEKLIPARLREAHRLHREAYQRAPDYRPTEATR